MEVDSLVHKTGSKSENHMEEEQISDLQAQIDSVESVGFGFNQMIIKKFI